MECRIRRRLRHELSNLAFFPSVQILPRWRSTSTRHFRLVCNQQDRSGSQDDKPRSQPQRSSPGNLISEEDWLVRSRIRRSPDIAANTKIVVCGGGSFGTAMANLLARNGYPVSLLVRKPWVRDEINLEHRNPKYLSEYLLPHNLTATVDREEAFRDAKLCVHAIPVQATREFLLSIRDTFPDRLPILCTSKGLEISSLSLMCELLPRMLGTDRKYAYLSGPSFAAEIIQGLPTAVVVASSDRIFANSLADMFSSASFKVFTSTDTVGLEVAGAIKNVIAIAAGMSDGLGLGTNSMAALVTRGCSEMRRIAIAQGASPVTLAGLSGVARGETAGAEDRQRAAGARPSTSIYALPLYPHYHGHISTALQYLRRVDAAASSVDRRHPWLETRLAAHAAETGRCGFPNSVFLLRGCVV